MRTGLTLHATTRRMKYLITYEKKGRHGLFPATSATTIEAKNMIDATVKALKAVNSNERVKSVKALQ